MSYNKPWPVNKIIKEALKEDIGKGDITTQKFIPQDKFARAVLLAKEDCVVCGLEVARAVFKEQDKGIRFKPRVLEGRFVKKQTILAQISGKAGNILSAERVALNFFALLCGIATKTRAYVNAVKPYKVKIMDTRKTIPGLRELQKYAVKVGGGYNHRMRLDDMVLIKDNHLKVIGDRLRVVGLKGIRDKLPAQVKIEVEVENLKEFKKALKLKPDIIMLDNMSVKDMKKAVVLRNIRKPPACPVGRHTGHRTPKLEASGGITLKNIKKIAATGVGMISIGALTHSLESVDISLEIL